jgi:uncharacterized membrane protein (DUF4010 family)
MSKRIAGHSLRFGAWAVMALAAWQLLPDRYMGPYQAWNPHAIMEFVITIFSISLAGKLAVHVLGAHYGLLVTGLMGGFASSTATIHTMGTVARLQPKLADRAALGGVLSNIATLLQLAVLLQLLAPALLVLFIQPLCFGLVGMCAYAAWVLALAKPARHNRVTTDEAVPFDWRSLLTLTAVVCGVSYASAALNALYGQSGLWLGAALSGLVDAHAIVPTVAALLMKDKLLPHDALMPLLIALSANTLTKSLIAFQSGGWAYTRQVSGGVCLTTVAVWLGYIAKGADFGF